MLAPTVGLAATPAADAVATLDTLVYPVHVAPLPWPPSAEVVVAAEVTLPPPDPDDVADAAVVETTVPVAVAVLTTVPETLAVPPCRLRTAGAIHSQTIPVGDLLSVPHPQAPPSYVSEDHHWFNSPRSTPSITAW